MPGIKVADDATMLRIAVVLAAVLLVAGCSEDSGVAEAPATAPRTSEEGKDARAPAAGPTGTIEARVTFAGAPVVETLKVNKDVEQCGTETTIETIRVGDDQGLAHAVVSVSGLDGPRTARTPQLDQRGCQFRPHVVAMQPGEIQILNSDGILHNVHTYSEANPPINKAQPRFKKVMTEEFTKPEVIKVTCDVHSWMRGWVVVLPHPYFGVTDARGSTRIEAVPAGRHTLEAWHETLGRRTQDVTVNAGETVRVVIEFPPTDRS
jgi:plastocyanin